MLPGNERSTEGMLIGVDMARKGANGTLWSAEKVYHWGRKRNLERFGRTAAVHAAYVRAGCWDGATPEALSDLEAQLPFAENKGKACNLALLQKVHRAEAALEAARQPLPSFYDFAAAVELEGRVGSVEHASAASVVTLQDEPDGFAMTTVKHHGSSLATTLTPVV